MYASELAAASYGQGITVTPIQMIQALTSLTNKGVILKPYIVKKITDQDGLVVTENKRTELKKVYSKETVKKVMELMDQTVNSEDQLVTGYVYKTDQVRLIGKTGTAQYTSTTGEYTTGTKNIRSFAGIFPKDNPKYIIYVAVKDLDGSSVVMGNMTKSVVESIAKYKNLSERESNKDESKYIILDNYLNKNIKEITDKLNELGLNTIIIGDGDTITKQYPKKNKSIIIGSKVYLKTNGNKIVLPDINNLSKTDLITLLNFMEVDYEIHGDGKIVSSSIPIGSEINEKLIINLEEGEI